MLTRIFPRNEHTIERVGRAGLGIVLLSLMFIGPKTNWGLVGLIPLATGLLGSCPLYTLLGINTCRINRNKHVATKI